MNNEVYIRVDGNEIIASGHVMRCLSIAERLRDKGCEVIFVLADVAPKEIIVEKGFKTYILNSVWNDLNQEIDIFCKYLSDNKVETLILDTYFVTPEYLKEISKYVKVVYIDDLKKFPYEVDTIIHYSPFGKVEEYTKLYYGFDVLPKIFCGSKYIPLRYEFEHKEYDVKENVTKVLITTGGTDQLNVAGKLLERVLSNVDLKMLEYHVIVGCFNKNKDNLNKIVEKSRNVFLHENVNNISKWMRECDVAVSAGGTTLYELCSCGIPTICLEIADNQNGAIVWQQEDYMEYAGNAYKDMDLCMLNCESSLLKYMNNYELRMKRSQKEQNLVDGNGAIRIAELILQRIKI